MSTPHPIPTSQPAPQATPSTPQGHSLAGRELVQIGEFLGTYATELLGCGATSVRVEKNTQRMATAYGVNLQMSVLPHHASITVADKDHNKSFTLVSTVTQHGISFYKNTALSRLSWKVYDNHIPASRALREYTHICRTRANRPGLLMLLVACANMAFCKLFDGDLPAMMVVFAAAYVGYGVKAFLTRKRVDARVVYFVTAFCAALIGSLCFVFHWGSTPDVALGTSILFLIPGVPFINSVIDLIYQHNLSFLSRLIDAVVLTICLSWGLHLALWVTHITLTS